MNTTHIPCPHDSHNPNGCIWCPEGPSLGNLEAKAKIARLRKRAEARRSARQLEARGLSVAARLARAGAR